ncbi:MAG: helix-turn-helix transcriptional regulator [Clostridia bacterium]|nr:helix-turn-helix transcriptional regulator [Clostridia bacterium]
MSFGENISYFRKKCGLTQDELAEKLSLSRQTVSRWENGSSLPDVDTLIKLCDLFGCDMDTLVRGNPQSKDEPSKAKEPYKSEEKQSYLNGEKYGSSVPFEYDRHMNLFALMMGLGVWLILFGLSAMFMIYAFTNLEAVGVATFLCFVGVAVAIFITSGIKHSNFKKDNPKIAPYPKDEIDKYNKKHPIFISLATAIIIAGVSMIVLCLYDESYYPSFFATVEKWDSFVMSLFFLLLSASVFTYIYSSILKSKYSVEEYNKEVAKEKREKTEKEKQEEKIKNLVSSIIMGTATMVFLILGFTLDLWHPAWVAFPIGGILAGLVNSIITTVRK